MRIPPPNDAVLVTPNDSTVVNLSGVYCTKAGVLTVITAAGNTVSATMQVGTTLALQIGVLKSTGTTGRYLGLRDTTPSRIP